MRKKKISIWTYIWGYSALFMSHLRVAWITAKMILIIIWYVRVPRWLFKEEDE